VVDTGSQPVAGLYFETTNTYPVWFVCASLNKLRQAHWLSGACWQEAFACGEISTNVRAKIMSGLTFFRGTC